MEIFIPVDLNSYKISLKISFASVCHCTEIYLYNFIADSMSRGQIKFLLTALYMLRRLDIYWLLWKSLSSCSRVISEQILNETRMSHTVTLSAVFKRSQVKIYICQYIVSRAIKCCGFRVSFPSLWTWFPYRVVLADDR